MTVREEVLKAIPVMPHFTTASRLAEQLPFSRSSIDRALRSLMWPKDHSSEVFVLGGGREGGTRMYARYREGSLL
jgi:hypothetical protein